MNCPPEKAETEVVFEGTEGAPHLVIYSCTEHDHSEAFYNGQCMWSNDYSYENVLRVAEQLGWRVENVRMDSAEFERCFA